MSRTNPIRRRVVLASSASLLTGLAGCSGVFNFDQSTDPETYRPPPLHEIEIKNLFEKEKELEVVVERDGNLVYWETRKVPPANPKPEEKFLGRVFTITKKKWMGCGAYEVSARVMNESLSETMDLRELEPSPSLEGEFQPVELRIEFRSDEIEMNTTRLDEPLIRCEETQRTQD